MRQRWVREGRILDRELQQEGDRSAREDEAFRIEVRVQEKFKMALFEVCPSFYSQSFNFDVH
jgi:hypothetical protein